jgi:hypothetical protein
MTGPTIRQVRMQQGLDALAFSVLASSRQMQWTDWYSTTKTRRGKLGLSTCTFSEAVKRLMAHGRVQLDGDGCYQMVFDAKDLETAHTQMQPEGATDRDTDVVKISPVRNDQHDIADHGDIAAQAPQKHTLTDTNAAAIEPNRFVKASEAPEAPEVSKVVPPLPAALQEAMAEIEKLRAENKQLLDWILGDTDALTCLQRIYLDPESSDHTRIKAATGALPFERSKPATSVVVMDFRERVRQARLASTAELIEQAKTIEHIPDESASG